MIKAESFNVVPYASIESKGSNFITPFTQLQQMATTSLILHSDLPPPSPLSPLPFPSPLSLPPLPSSLPSPHHDGLLTPRCYDESIITGEPGGGWEGWRGDGEGRGGEGKGR